MSMHYCYSLTESQVALLPSLDGEHVGFEIRLDTFQQEPDFAHIRSLTKRPLLATWRTKPHLGQVDVSTRPQGWEWRNKALAAGFDFIDIELDEAHLAEHITRIQENCARVVLSHHDLKGDALLEPLERALKTEAAIIKIIGTGTKTVDFATQKALYQRAGQRDFVHFFMGAEFTGTRVLSLVYGRAFTFITADPSNAVAPGQLTYEALEQVYKPLEIDPKQLQLYGVIGSPVGHSRSPSYHNSRLKEQQPNSLFITIPASSKADFDLIMGMPELRGIAITKPMKEIAYQAATTFTDQGSEKSGAINTLLMSDQNKTGANTDQLAMMAMLAPYRDLKVRILGYGGLGKAVAAACEAEGIPFEVCNRTLEKIPATFEKLPWDERHKAGAEVIVQATSVGMAPAVEQSPLDRIPEGTRCVIETIYNPSETQLMKQAKAAGVEIVDGHTLFDKQAERQNAFFIQQQETLA